ncbi:MULTISPECIES: phosphate-starvation-inducible PsiE family protein [unclassified Pseudomonas]|uniref:phosphate-starvation-inducible PsiE family protein n=1 Tax=unclassified Pseudomonas TaxID=196821 RepID=UPI0014737D6F|nr:MULTISPECIES: phosphate-starvation-inducible PsiE family protein [unclassified Pseudomonas]NMX92782.1 phosphate-starvation-inducible E [Pseudomonas sp. WS 5086]NMY47556.1 phosphate-starvation-inducible E [Pseudomonas sp. WS 5027]
MTEMKWADKVRKSLHANADSLGNLAVEAFHYLALFGIGAITAYAAIMTFIDMLQKGGISVDDILLLFIYLELGAMVGIYFKTKVYVTNIFISDDKRPKALLILGFCLHRRSSKANPCHTISAR